MNNKQDVLQIFGCLMKKPSLLGQIDKYDLSYEDFSTQFDQRIFDAIEILYHNGASVINPIDIENLFSSKPILKTVYEKNNGFDFLTDALALSELDNFDYYYKHFKKTQLLKDINSDGFATSDIYSENLIDINSEKINREFDNLDIPDIFNHIKKKLSKHEKKYMKNGALKTQNIFQGIADIVEDAKEGSDIGLPLQGKLINTVMSGARKGTFCLRSGASGGFKTRTMVGDACFLAFPFRFNTSTYEWEQKGSCEKVLLVVTEQDVKEVQRMVLAYLTGINESRFRFGQFTAFEEKVIEQAIRILEEYQDNLLINEMPEPNVGLLKATVRDAALNDEIEYCFFDYIFVNPSVMGEFKGFSLRNDK